MRGTLKKGKRNEGHLRITPAHAGNTIICDKSLVKFKDHPRPCGEHIKWGIIFCATGGSPPPMRGTRRLYYGESSRYRITPAHAGNTTHLPQMIYTSKDHPRPCGEHLFLGRLWLPTKGSPPPMRGTRQTGWNTKALVRITPAHAGNTCDNRRVLRKE